MGFASVYVCTLSVCRRRWALPVCTCAPCQSVCVDGLRQCVRVHSVSLSDLCVHIVWSVQVLNPTMTKCVGSEGGGGKEITDRYCGG